MLTEHGGLVGLAVRMIPETGLPSDLLEESSHNCVKTVK